MSVQTHDFEAWQNMITAVCGYFTVSHPKPKTFQGDIKLGRFGAMDIAEISANVASIKKTKQDISRSDDANLFLIMGLEGEALLEQDGSSARLKIGDICIIDSRLPSEFKYKNGFKQISVHLPEMQTREVFRRHDIPLAQILKSKSNERLRACVLTMYNRAHTDDNDQNIDPSNIDENKYNDECYKLLWQAIFNGEDLTIKGDWDPHLYHRVIRFIECNLYDPDLNLDVIANTCGITLRTLHRLFERHDLSPANWIRMRRLELARNKLMSGTHKHSCTDIAYACGFNSSAHFSRVFKHKFGIPPQKFQTQIMQ